MLIVLLRILWLELQYCACSLGKKTHLLRTVQIKQITTKKCFAYDWYTCVPANIGLYISVFLAIHNEAMDTNNALRLADEMFVCVANSFYSTRVLSIHMSAGCIRTHGPLRRTRNQNKALFKMSHCRYVGSGVRSCSGKTPALPPELRTSTTRCLAAAVTEAWQYGRSPLAACRQNTCIAYRSYICSAFVVHSKEITHKTMPFRIIHNIMENVWRD